MLDWLYSPFTAVHELIGMGGIAVFFIFSACLLLWTLSIERYWFYKQVLPQQAAQYLSQWQQRRDHHSWLSRQVRQMFISRLNSAMNANLLVMRVLVPLCPLLGLLGTVSGMLDVFDSMAARGSADARTMASGVSQAMICTLTGLAVSISGLYPVYYFTARARRETELLADKFAY